MVRHYARVPQVVYEKQVFRFREPLLLTLEVEDGWYTIDFSPLDIYAGGKTEEEAWHEFSEEVYLLWNFYANMNDQEMTPGAIKVKNCLTKNITVGDISD